MTTNRKYPGLVALLLGALVSAPCLATDIKEWSERAETGDNQRVLQELAQYLAKNPDEYPVMFLQGRLQVKQGDMQAAIKTYQQLIQRQPSRPEAYNNLAAVYAAQGDYEQAQRLLEQAIQTHPSYAAVYENLSHIYVEKARSSYGKALQLDAGKNVIALQELKTIPTAAVTMPLPATPANTTTVAAPPVANTTAHVAGNADSPSSPQFDKEAVITTLQGWAAAWSEQAADVYLIFYSQDYVPEGMSRESWEQERRERVNKPKWIQIGLSNFQVEQLANGEAKVQMVQEYRASNYQDKTKKLVRLRQTPDGWRIVAEHSVANLN